MHNFPKNIDVACTDVHTLQQGKEILKLCIQHDVPFKGDLPKEIVDKSYPRFIWDEETKGLTQTENDAPSQEKRISKEIIWVSMKEFRKFIRGTGNTSLIPFKEEIALNESRLAEISKENVKVGCETFTHEKIAELYQLSVKAQKSKY